MGSARHKSILAARPMNPSQGSREETYQVRQQESAVTEKNSACAPK